MKKGYRILLVLPFFAVFSCGTQSREEVLNASRNEIIQVMRDQEAAWNRGDMPGFMEGYAKSDSTLFAGKTRVNYGWQTVLDGYLKAYPDKAAMGTLHFDLIRVMPLSDTHAYVVGKWTLIENQKPASGHFVLIFEHSEKGWQIIVDGTS